MGKPFCSLQVKFMARRVSWGEEKTEELLKLVDTGLKPAEISKKMGIPCNKIRSKIGNMKNEKKDQPKRV